MDREIIKVSCNDDINDLYNDFLSKMRKYPLAYVNMAFNMARLKYDEVSLIEDAEKYYREVK